MPSASYHFPKNFLWGTATSSHQVEGGNNNNNWSRWEEQGHTPHKSGLACDWWGEQWREDFDRAAKSGQNAIRLSLEWSRIQPSPYTWDQASLDRYRGMLQGAAARGLTPMVTLHHFTDPLWVTDQGAWENEATVSLFAAYVRRVVEVLKEQCSLWCTINEPNVYAIEGYLRCSYPPGTYSLKNFLLVQANLLRAHAAAYRIIHELQPNAQVGYALHFRPQRPAHPRFPPDAWMSKLKFSAINMAFPSAISTGIMRSPVGKVPIPEAVGTQDYLGLNYYNPDTVAFDLRMPKELFSRSFFPKGSDVSEAGTNANIPSGFFPSLKWIHKTYPNLPVYVTENGIEDASDHIRPRYLAEHVHAMWRAVNFTWPVRGYFHWTLVDNFEWERGWNQRFGLWELDVETQERHKRPSADLYEAICRENGLTSTMVEQYCPEAFGRLFPG